MITMSTIYKICGNGIVTRDLLMDYWYSKLRHGGRCEICTIFCPQRSEISIKSSQKREKNDIFVVNLQNK